MSLGRSSLGCPHLFRTSGLPAYWSLDPTGVERLSAEEAKDLGFPSFEFAATAHVYSWDADVYDGLRQFHEAKGFDPYSQDVARHMGHRLFQLSDRMEAVSAHRESGRAPGLIMLMELNSGRDQ
ncbi:hypothetical protein B0H17DRAFT_357203 [Mycena rosella]|uniref:Uncharacterized protein n=1 Tax=Mycena rosella TaxID=1033263 RepID=A0AAD7CPT8_MYCRO|nr:hypothetical protein B0H17DRAFT_357203 [Mycena rosella]